MAKKESFHPYFVGTEHGRLSFGTIRKNNEISACMLQSGPDGGRHYITMDSTGNKEEGMRGSTKAFCPGTLTVKTGKDIENYTIPSLKPNNIPAIFYEAENGDIVLTAPRGKIKIAAEAIELIAKGSDGRTGVINLNADDKIILDSQIIDVQSKVSTKIFSENTVHIIGKSLLNIYGGLADFADGATKHRRSKLSADDSVVSQNEVENAK